MDPSGHEKARWLDRPGNVDRVVRTVYLMCAISVALEFFIDRHETLAFAEWFGFYAWYGFVACVGLVLAAKAMRTIVKRREDYYDAGGNDSEGRG